MPTYDYACEACGKRFEKFQPITAAADPQVPRLRPEQGPPADRARGGGHLQGQRLLPDRLPQRRLPQGRREGQARRAAAPSGGSSSAEGSAGGPAADSSKAKPKADSPASRRPRRSGSWRPRGTDLTGNAWGRTYNAARSA